jgi:two-component system KDP operon response regulator KdpE
MSLVLAVDDEPAILRLLSAVLTRGGYEIATAADAKNALAQVERADAFILDLGLPDRDGLELIAAIRAKSAVPIIVLTARHDVADKITALDLGADDYVTKPFDGGELLARLRSALRRTGGAGATDRIEHGPIVMNIARHEVSHDGRAVALTPREFAVLQALIEAQGRVLTHRALLERVWGKAHGEDVEYLRVVIRALRLKLEVDPSAPALIRNEPAIGYRLAG